MISSYTAGMPYETFIRRAFKCPRGSKHGADGAYMTNLIDAESGAKQFKLGTPEKQLSNIKDNISKALDKFLRFKLSPQESETITHLKNRTEGANSSYDLQQVLDEGLEVTQRFKG